MDKTYTEGLNDAWEMAKKIDLMSYEELCSIFNGHSSFRWIMANFTPQEALERIESYEKTGFKVGDVVESIFSKRIGVVTRIEENGKYVMFTDGMSGMLAHDDIRKTNKHIDITSVLEQLRGDKYED